MCKILNELLKAMKASGLSAAAIARKAGVSETALSFFLNGQRGLSVESMEKLCNALGYDVVMKPTQKRR